MTDAPILLTPGPLTTREATRRAMLKDWGSRDPAFVALTAELRERLLGVAGGHGSHAAVPLQGSGTFAVEATIATLVRRADRLLVLANGAYGDRMISIATRLGLDVRALRWAEDVAIDPGAVDAALEADPGITHVALVHCETTTGLLNPMEAVAQIVARHGRRLLLDAMASFGALPIDLATTPITAVIASSNKCLEGTPGLGFTLIETSVLGAAEGACASLSLDLHAQWRGFQANGQWRFTPPVQVVAALVEALRALDQEGGAPARLARYSDNLDVLVRGMARFGFELYLAPALQAPIIATFRTPGDGRFVFSRFYDGLAKRGFLIYPGKLTRGESFRIGCIGALDRRDFERLLTAVGEVMAETA